MATLVGISRLAKDGIIFKEANKLETMAKATLIAFDKTGTLTLGKPKVVAFHPDNAFDANLVYSLVKLSNHPISKGVEEFLKEKYENLKEISFDEFKEIPAKGIYAKKDNIEILGGNKELLESFGIKYQKESENSSFIVAVNQKVIAEFELRDIIKPEAKELIQTLHKLGLKVAMLTGDNEKVATKIAKELHIDKVYAKLLPQDKAKLIDEFHKNGEIVIMVGDGINDSIALAKSDIAIAMGSGADVAIEVSDVILLNDSLYSLQRAIVVSRKVFKTIKENLSFSLLYNIVVIPLAVAGYVNPLFAALAMSLSSLFVVGNSFRIYRS